jgi:hypothetical protein
VTVPHKDDVDWQGSRGTAGGGQRNITGFVKIDCPAPIPDPTVGEWNGPSSSYQNSDTYHYDLPSILEGFDIKVFGEHHEPGIDCVGSVTVRLDGGGIGNPLTLISLGFTVFTIINLALAVGVL